LDFTSWDGLSLAGFETFALETTVEVGPPLKRVPCEALIESTSHLPISVQALVFGTPLRYHRLDRTLPLLPRVPPRGPLIETIPAELLEDQLPLRLEQANEPIEPTSSTRAGAGGRAAKTKATRSTVGIIISPTSKVPLPWRA